MDPTTLIFLGLGALMLFFLFSSRKKQKARQESIKSNLVPGAEVMTTFGVYGTVLTVSPEDHIVTIESGPGTVLRIHQQAIGHIEPAAGVATDGLSEDTAADVDRDLAADDTMAADDRLADERVDDSDRLDNYRGGDYTADNDLDDRHRDDRGDDFKA
ncbi:preprotein translocase subunit YajC [Brevibacterium sp. p3-SID960]|uniref:preprotein translocase subunit YajC n=1 Tax=Brevibacterium sp. p3-SID960 TaxID=2916063 RepID=UPI0021A662A2|nr:preprotein translocase subunit YajC [Brevibacterium sp. p3-SID960]MCT1690197.1 preprotein translocase subunit YajC [Brevibacterium sp. p3-SID960]